MKHDHRTDERFEEFGKVESDRLCALPGVLDDISSGGCKVHFPLPVTVDMDSDYTLRMHVSVRNKPHSLLITCQPQWHRANGSGTDVGFRILPSPDTPMLAEYIDGLRLRGQDDFDVSDLLIAPRATFVG